MSLTEFNNTTSRLFEFCCAFLMFSDDKNLPSVPPLQLSVPADYPDQSPYWADDGEQYGETIFC